MLGPDPELNEKCTHGRSLLSPDANAHVCGGELRGPRPTGLCAARVGLFSARVGLFFHPSRALFSPSRAFLLRDSDRELAFLRLTRGESGGKKSTSGGESGGESGISADNSPPDSPPELGLGRPTRRGEEEIAGQNDQPPFIGLTNILCKKIENL